jgi:phosphoglycerate dehydrogenase-like enzyme
MKSLFFGMPVGRFDDIFPQHVRSTLSSLCSIADAPLPEQADTAFLRDNIGDAEILITSWGSPRVEEEVLAAAPKLELVAHAAGTVKPIVSDALWERGIRVTSAARAIADGVAEFCLALIMSASKRVFWYADDIRRGMWPKGDQAFGPAFEIYRQNVGIIGASFVGRKLISLLEPYSCNILLYDPYCTADEARELGATTVDSLDELFSSCRVVSLNAPTTDETIGMVQGRHFAMLPHGAVFVNTARGVVVKQDEMIEELRKGRFVACLDVTDPEPPVLDDPLRRLPNVIITPHEAGALKENRMRIGEFAAAEIQAFLQGKPMLGEVTKERLARLA